MPPKPKFPFLFPVLKNRCPHCSEDAVIGLFSRTADEPGIFPRAAYFLRCGDCGHEIHVEDGKADVWQRMRKAYEGLDTGKLTQDQFDTILEAADEPSINELLEDARIWTCQCGEENPMNFAECWSCGAETTGPVKDSTNGHIDPGGGELWEGNTPPSITPI